MLVSVRLEEVAGFDLSYLNRYRWHPQSERVDLSRSEAVSTVLSSLFRMPLSARLRKPNNPWTAVPAACAELSQDMSKYHSPHQA